jgi:hypothetical protein
MSAIRRKRRGSEVFEGEFTPMVKALIPDPSPMNGRREKDF